MNKKVSPQTETEALAVAKATQKQGQSKEQTKLIAKGIEKGIAEYKKQHKIKTRSRDKQKKLQNKSNQQHPLDTDIVLETHHKVNKFSVMLPWFLLGLSWLAFTVMYVIIPK